jgi:phage terminase large subunit GpA-like protein
MSHEHFPDAYSDAYSDACSGFQALRPPNRMTISAGAAHNLVIKQTGGSAGAWDADETPYMVEPMDALASRQHEAVVFVGPARTGKTAGLLLGWMAHNIVNDPGDMLFIQMSKEKAREFSKTDVDRALRNSPNVDAMRTGRVVDSNTHDTMFRHGMWLRIAWPTVGNVSGSTYRYVAITDIDRMENAENVDGEGPLFDLAKKRTTTFMSRGMTLVESSPGYPIIDPHWKAATPHEAPPVGGILNIYNRSDRHRWYWKCPDCNSRFEAAPGLSLFGLPPIQQLLEEVRTADLSAMSKHYSRIVAPCCGSIQPPERKQEMNRTGIWLPDNARFDDEDKIVGEPMQSTVRGYWLGGVAATFQSWRSILENYLQGLRDFALTGSEEKLKTTTNVDQGMPYLSRHLADAQGDAQTPEARAVLGMVRHVVPEWTRCVVASVDVQGGIGARFEVQVHAVGPFGEQQLVDRFHIKESMRPGMGAEFAPLDPAGYPEDWDVLTEKVLRATWRTPTEGREIRAKLVTVDTGGEGKGNGGEGVTHHAYDWFRRIRALGMGSRVMLYKGASDPKAPILKETMVGARGRFKGDIPLFMCNPNLLSDAVDSGLRRKTPGPGYIHFPAPKHPITNPNGWLPPAFFDELQAEVRDANGTWRKVRKRNESFDLCRMIRAGMLRLGIDKILNWQKVPAWLAPLDQNSEIVLREDRRAMQANEALPPEPRLQVVRPVRRARRSSVAAL